MSVRNSLKYQYLVRAFKPRIEFLFVNGEFRFQKFDQSHLLVMMYQLVTDKDKKCHSKSKPKEEYI